jgi:hypothetical protein
MGMGRKRSENLSQREREGPIAKRWEGEGLRCLQFERRPPFARSRDTRITRRDRNPSPSHHSGLRRIGGPLPLPLGEVVCAWSHDWIGAAR